MLCLHCLLCGLSPVSHNDDSGWRRIWVSAGGWKKVCVQDAGCPTAGIWHWKMRRMISVSCVMMTLCTATAMQNSWRRRLRKYRMRIWWCLTLKRSLLFRLFADAAGAGTAWNIRRPVGKTDHKTARCRHHDPFRIGRRRGRTDPGGQSCHRQREQNRHLLVKGRRDQQHTASDLRQYIRQYFIVGRSDEDIWINACDVLLHDRKQISDLQRCSPRTGRDNCDLYQWYRRFRDQQDGFHVCRRFLC